MRFLKSDKEKALQESNCYLHCIDTAFDLVESNEFAKAATYYENAARSLRELQKMKDAKQSFYQLDEGQHIVNQWIMNFGSRP